MIKAQPKRPEEAKRTPQRISAEKVVSGSPIQRNPKQRNVEANSVRSGRFGVHRGFHRTFYAVTEG